MRGILGKRIIVIGLVWVTALAGVGGASQAQEQQAAPLVAFVVDQQLETASVIDPGPDGLTRLERIFQQLGARTTYIRLSEPIPEDVKIIVMVRPWRAMPNDYLARLFVHMAHGNHVLWAIDPTGHVRNAADTARSGLVQLVNTDYGIQLLDAFIYQPWFTPASITEQATSYSWSYPIASADHPVLQPLLAYGLPVMIWGARPVDVEPLGVASWAQPILETRLGYGEANAQVFSTRTEPAPFVLNLDADYQGHLPIAALGEQTEYGSRIVVLGDSEIVQNDFGLAVAPDGVTPLHVGDWLLTERLAAWLLELPEEDWPGMPANVTLLAVDGRADDWAETPVFAEDTDDVGMQPRPEYDIQQVHAVRDDRYLYLLLETQDAPSERVRAILDLDMNADGAAETIVTATTERVAVSNTNDVPDAMLVASEAIEVRLPLRVAGQTPAVRRVCFSDRRTAFDSEPLDCIDLPADAVPAVPTTAPVPLRYPDGPLVTVTSTGAVNLRAEPSTESDIVERVFNGELFRVTGRNEDGDWVQVENARNRGWLADFLVVPNVDIAELPVVVVSE